MGKLLAIVFGFLTASSFGQTAELKWKIGQGEIVSYLTAMTDIDTSAMEFNFGGFVESFSDTTGEELLRAKEQFSQLNKSLKNFDFISTLTNSGNGIINVVMKAKQKAMQDLPPSDSTGFSRAQLLEMMQAMNNGVMLRGSVYTQGGIHSFWMKNEQKNILALLFELPKSPVKVGDTWQIDINLISSDQNFSCDSSFKINEVKLVNLKKINGEKIAVIKYNVVEYVNGTYYSPGFIGKGGDQQTMMRFSLQSIAEFSVNKGRWISYDGIMSMDATGPMTGSQKKKFSLKSE